MAFPTYQAAGAFVETATLNATVSPAWPTHQAGDVALLIVATGGKPIILTDYAGFRELPASHQHDWLNARSDNQTLAVFWKRATGAAEAAPVIKNTFRNAHVRACIVTFRGCAASGLPYDVMAGSKHGITDNNMPAPGLTTNFADSLIVFAVAAGPDTGSNAFTIGSNAALAAITERIDSVSLIGDGSATGVFTAQKATAGAFGTTPIAYNIANNSRKGIITIALTAVVHADPKTPYLHAIGEEASSLTANITPAWPQHAANDIGLLIVESDDFPITTPAGGWAHVTGSPQSAGSPGDPGATSLSVFWKRAASGAEAAPTVTFRSDHIRAFIATVKECKTVGDPFDAGAGSNTVPGSSSIVLPGVTTLQAHSLILHIASPKGDNDGIDFDSWANANLKNISERFDNADAMGSGSDIVLLRATKESAGSTGNTTGVYSTGAGVHAKITLSFPPSAKGMDVDTGQFSLTGQPAVLAAGKSMVADTGAFALTGQAVIMDKVRSVTLDAETGQFATAGQDIVLEKEFGRWVKEWEKDWEKDPAAAAAVWTYQTPEE